MPRFVSTLFRRTRSASRTMRAPPDALPAKSRFSISSATSWAASCAKAAASTADAANEVESIPPAATVTPAERGRVGVAHTDEITLALTLSMEESVRDGVAHTVLTISSHALSERDGVAQTEET